MKSTDIVDALASTGFPVTYYQWPENEAPPLPYICYYYPNVTPETADNTHHADIYRLNVELYTKNKQFDAETRVEQALLRAGLVFTRDEDYLKTEHMYEVLYMTEVFIDG